MKKQNSAYIGAITVTSSYPFVVYGDVRGLQGEHRTLSAAEKTLARDARACSKAGGYSDCSIYQWSDEGWSLADRY